MNRTILVADAGSTKTAWAIFNSESQPRYITTEGINPIQMSALAISEVVVSQLFPLIDGCSDVDEIHFYGAGCIDDIACNSISTILKEAFPSVKTIEIATDLLGAARAVCQHSPGIACILGTGSNSCLYDGDQILRNVSPLGYILGDEGSGAVLGRTLISDVLKNQLPEDLCRNFLEKYDLTAPTIIRKVYREQGANTWMASFVPFLKENISDPYIRGLVKHQFELFFKRNVAQYDGWNTLPINFVGSIALHFKDILFETAIECGCNPDKIIASPIDNLVEFHK